MMLTGATGYAKRAVDLLGKANVRLQIWAKADSFEPGDSAECLISPDGTNWTPVQLWEDGDDDGAYHFYDIDLLPYTMSSQFWIAVDANMSGPDDHLFIDYVVIRSAPSGAVLSPSDDFESGDWIGGLGWLYSWSHQGRASVTKKKGLVAPYQGLYHMWISDDGSSVSRAADLSGQSGLRLQFWAAVDSFEGGDEAYCAVSSDGVQWTTVRTWTSADSDRTYHFYDIDLSPYTMSSEFWIAFNSGMNSPNDYFYVDLLEIVGGGGGVGPSAIPYEIVSSAASKTIRALVFIEGTQIAVLSWVTE